jgi:hypothetical protein
MRLLFLEKVFLGNRKVEKYPVIRTDEFFEEYEFNYMEENIIKDYIYYPEIRIIA